LGGDGLSSHKLSRVEDSLGIEGLFEGRVDGATDGRGCLRPPPFFGESDAVFPRNDAPPFENFGKEFIESLGDLFFDGTAFVVASGHEVDMNISISSVAKAGDGEAVFFSEFFGKKGEVSESTTGDNDIFVELWQAGCFEGLGKCAAQIPEFLASEFAKGGFHSAGVQFLEEVGEGFHFTGDRGFLAIEIQKEMSAAAGGEDFSEVGAGGCQSEGIGDFEGGGKKAFGKNGLDGIGSLAEGAETGGEGRACGREWEEAEGGFGDHAEETLASDKHPDEIEARLIFVSTAASSEDASVC